MFRRSGDRCCNKYFNENNPEVALFLREKQWIINTNITKLDSSSCPNLRYYTKDTIETKDFEAKNVEFCTPLKGYVVYDDVSIIMDKTGKNCQDHLEEMLKDAKEDENVFMSTTHLFVSVDWETECSFALVKDANIRREESKSSSLTLHTRDCNKMIQHNITEVCTNDEVNDEEIQSDERSVDIFVTIAIAVTILVGIIFFVLFCLKRKEVICKKDDSRAEAIVHQNDLYGNVTNEDYFNERYVTNIVHTNQYYDDEYQP